MTSPFDYVNSVSHTKKHLMADPDNDKLAERDYVPFLVNNALSYFPDTILAANMLNIRPGMSNKLQYLFLLNNIRPRKRFAKWAKPEEDDDLVLIQDYFKCSFEKAKAKLSLLSKEQIKMIRERVITGVE